METNKKEAWVKSVEVMLFKGDFPMNKEDAKYRLNMLEVDGKPMETMLDRIQWPVKSRDELISKLSQAKGSS